MLAWHWSPNNGFAMNHAIRGWNETLITYVLAAGAPRYGIEADVYEKGFCAGPDYRSGKTYYGVTLPLGPELGGPLFFAHYSFCGLDPHDLKDRHANYWQQNVAQVKINLAHCVANPGGFKGYSANCWGLTASDDADGYDAHAPGHDNGTVSPTAALVQLSLCPRGGDAGPAPFSEKAKTLGPLWLYRCLQRDAGLDRRYLSRHRPGPDCGDDRELPQRAVMEIVHGGAGGAARPAQAGFHQPASMTARFMSLEDWIISQRRHAAAMMRQSISPAIVKNRPHFFQTIIPKPGAVVASPVLAAYDPEPDYFFHWYRDSAVVMDALCLVRMRCRMRHGLFADFCASVRTWRRWMAASCRRPGPKRILLNFFAGICRMPMAPRSRGNAGQSRRHARRHRLAAARNMTARRCARWPCCAGAWPAITAASLLRADLAFVLHHARQPCFGIWEEEFGLHYYVLRVSAAALEKGAAWLKAQGDHDFAARCAAGARTLRRDLEDWWLPDEGFIRAHILSSRRAEKELDVSVILAANHAGAAPDERLKATLAKLELLFGALYPINRGRAAPALGRYGEDTYYGGGAWYAATLAAAEFCYRGGDAGARRRLSGNGARLHPRQRRHVRAIRPCDRRTDLGPAPGLELCCLHHRYIRASRGQRIKANNHKPGRPTAGKKPSSAHKGL